MDKDQRSLLRSDILENLGHRHYDSPAYQLFKELLYDGGDPMEFRDYLVKVQKACKGEWSGAVLGNAEIILQAA